MTLCLKTYYKDMEPSWQNRVVDSYIYFKNYFFTVIPMSLGGAWLYMRPF